MCDSTGKDAPCVDTLDDFDELLGMVRADSSLIDTLTDEQVTELRKKMNPYGRTIEGKDKLTCLSITNLSEQYMRKFLMTSLIGFLYRQCDEHELADGEPTSPLDDFNDFMEKFSLARDAALVSAEWLRVFAADHVGVEECALTLEEKADRLNHSRLVERGEGFKRRLVVRQFLDSLFQFNPDSHVRSAYSDNPLDPERVVPAQMARKDEDGEALEESDAQRSVSKFVKHIPPADVFHRWTYYTDCNYEELRTAVQDLYCEKPDLEFAINPYAQFDDQESSEKFIQKHKTEVIADICTLTNGKWNLCGSFKKNRERINFYNEKTAVIEEIFKQMESDKKLGADLMRKRVKRKKKKNIEESGADPEAFINYKKENTSSFEVMGAEPVLKDDVNEVSVQSSGIHDECPYDAVQVDVFDFRNGGAIVEKSEFFTEAESPKTLELCES